MDQSVRLLLTQVTGPGHEHALNWQKEVGDMEFEWMRTYGPTWRIGGSLGVRMSERVHDLELTPVLSERNFDDRGPEGWLTRPLSATFGCSHSSCSSGATTHLPKLRVQLH